MTTSAIPATGSSTATTGADGKATIEFPTTAPSGAFTLHYSVPADNNGNGAIAEKTLVVKAGQAKLDLTPGDSAFNAGDGVAHTFTGNLALEDGTDLAGRDVVFNYTRGTEKAPANGTADAGIVDGANLVLTKTVKTDASGDASVDVKDPTETAPAKAGSELGGKLDAATGNTAATGASTLAGNASASDSSKVDFTSAASVKEVVLTRTDNGFAKPGDPVLYTVQVKSDSGTSLTGQDVSVTVDHGLLYQTDATGDAVEDMTTPISNDYVPATSQTTVNTGATGTAYVAWGVERDVDFDDNGSLIGTIKVTASGLDDTEKVRRYPATSRMTSATRSRTRTPATSASPSTSARRRSSSRRTRTAPSCRRPRPTSRGCTSTTS